MKVQNKVIVVTGAGSGMGREIVLNLLSKGASVAALDLNEKSLQETANLAGNKKEKLATFVLKVTDKSAVDAFPDKVIARFGTVDGIINNAGIIQPFVRLNDLKFDAIERVLNVNLYGVLYMTKAFLPHLLKSPVAHVANVSSMGGFKIKPPATNFEVVCLQVIAKDGIQQADAFRQVIESMIKSTVPRRFVSQSVFQNSE